MKRVFAFSAVIVPVLLIEAAILSNWYVLPVMPDLLLLTLLYTAVHNGSTIGETYGFFSGLLLDFTFTGPLGLHALVRTVIGFACGLFYRTLNTRGIILPAVMGFSATLIKALLIRFLSFFYPDSIVTYSLFSPILWYECLFNAVCAPVLFWFLSFFKILAEDYTSEKLE